MNSTLLQRPMSEERVTCSVLSSRGPLRGTGVAADETRPGPRREPTMRRESTRSARSRGQHRFSRRRRGRGQHSRRSHRACAERYRCARSSLWRPLRRGQSPHPPRCLARLAVTFATSFNLGVPSVRYRTSHRLAAGSNFGDPRSAYRWTSCRASSSERFGSSRAASSASHSARRSIARRKRTWAWGCAVKNVCSHGISRHTCNAFLAIAGG